MEAAHEFLIEGCRFDAGRRRRAQTGDTVPVNYTGWLYENGKRTTQFDSSLGPGRKPFEMTIGRTSVIKAGRKVWSA